LVKLSTGEEVLGYVNVADAVNMGFVTVFEGLLVFMQQSPDGKSVGIGVLDWLPYAKTKEGVRVYLTQIVYLVDPADKLAEMYRQKMSPIKTPGTGILLPT
jgi:hypothetical protein